MDIASPTTRTAIALLGDPDPDVRLRMALELGESRHAEAAPALVARFGVERDFSIRETLTWAVLRMADAAMPLVREALASPRWLARLQATHTVSKLGAREDGARLVPLMADPIDVVASRAYWAAAQCGDPAVVPALVAELSRGSSAHRNSLTVALTDFGDVAVSPLVSALRAGATAAVRQHAADTLGYIGSPTADAAAPALIAAAQDPDEGVRLAALNALGQLVVPAAWDVIEGARGAGGRLGVLAARLAERRPSDRALRMAALRGSRSSPLDVGGVDAPPARSWPAPDPGLVTLEGGPWAAELIAPLALQVAVCRPRWLSRAEVPADVLAEVHAAALADALAEGTPDPDAIAERVAAGRVEQFVHEHVLLEQVSVADPGVIVADLLRGTEVRVVDLVRR
ncbi:HEAT repeat domain-containing protein [Euzebya sp.]|uniref:HEAT repeat domain-containing protein n=1 Tax=Euzebya sp. TaxID=1971409 RepID=UPI003515693F